MRTPSRAASRRRDIPATARTLLTLLCLPIAAALLAACSSAGSSAPGDGSGTQPGTGHVTTTSGPTRPSRPHPRPVHRPGAPTALQPGNGSLGVATTDDACYLLTRGQIEGQFGGPVGAATPTYPYCQWLVGSNAFLALDVEPGVSFASATRYVVPLQPISGLGQQAEIANNRYLYFTANGTSYWLLWQQAGDFTTLNQGQLVALARDVLAHGSPPRRSPAPPLGPTGPPIYFAGDSTAAGPEWAFATYWTTAATHTLCEYQVGSGLVVPGYFDWSRHLLAVTLARRPRLVIYMGSANDGQDLLYHGTYQPPGSPGWRAAYGEIVGAVMASVTKAGARLLWIGEPAMQSPTLSADMRAMNQVLAAEAASHKGVTFFDPGTVLNGPGGSYKPNVVFDGKSTPARLDGVHLNYYGSLYLARFIAAYVKRLLPPPPAKRTPAPVKRSHARGRH